jgi:hypothetical protein
MRRIALLLAIATLTLLIGRTSPAQPKPDDAKKVDRVIYLPFRDLWKVFEKQTSTVVLPYQEYLDLKKKAEQVPVDGQEVKAVITEANYVATVEEDLARIQVTLKINVLGKPWVELPLRFGDAAVGKLEGGEKVVLRGTDNGAYSLMLGAAGEQTVKLELAARIQTSPNGREFALDCPTVGITTFEIAIPEEGQAIDVTPKVVTLPAKSEEKETRFKASLGSTNRIAARWYPKASMKPEMDLLTSVTNRTRVMIEDGLVHDDAYLTYEILRGTLSELRIAVPKSHRILDVTADARLKGWQVKNEATRQVVTVELLAPHEGKLNVEVHTEDKLPVEAFDVGGAADDGTHGIHALDIVRESGQIAVRQSGDLTLTVVEQQGVTRIDNAELDDRLKGEGVLGFKFYNPKLTLKVLAKALEPRLIVDHAADVAFLDDEIRISSKLNYTVDRAGIFQFQFKLPDGVTVDNVDCAQMKEFNVDAATKTLVVSLREKTQGAIEVHFRGHRSYAAGKGMDELILPVIEPVGVERETGLVRVYARESIEIITNEKGLVAAQPVPATGEARVGDVLLNSVWSFTRRPVAIPVTTIRKPTRLSATIATKVNVQPELTDVETKLKYLVEYSGIDTFRFLVPAAVNDRVQITAASGATVAIKQKTAGEAQNAWIPWTVITQRELTGPVEFVIRYDLKPAAGADAARNALIQAVRPLGYEKGDQKTPLSNVEGEIAVFKDDSLAVGATATGGDVEPIDVRELQSLPHDGTLAFRYYTQPDDGSIDVNLEQTKFDIQKVVPTIVSRALTEVVIGEGQEATYRARFQMKTTERQRLLVQLPLGLQLLGVYVGDNEVRLEKAEIGDKQKFGENWEPYWLNVIRKGRGEDEFVVTFHFQWSVNPPFGESRGGRGKLLLPLPAFGGAEARVPVQQQKVAIYVPRKYSLVGNPDNFLVEEQPSLERALFGPGPTRSHDARSCDGFITAAGGQTTFPLPTEGRDAFVYSNLGGATSIQVVWWNKVTVAIFFSIAAAVIGLVLVRTTWENKLTLLLIALFAATLYGLKDLHALAHGLTAVRYGLLLLLAIWLVHAIFGSRRQNVVVTTPTPPPPPETPPAEAPPSPS